MRSTASVFVEVLAVLFVVGLLAVVAIPDYDDRQPEVRLKVLIGSLERVRTALDRYWGDHDARFPELQSVQCLEEPIRAARLRAGLGRYLKSVPVNPFTGGNRVAAPDAPVGTSDWIYDPLTGIFKANNSVRHRAL